MPIPPKEMERFLQLLNWGVAGAGAGGAFVIGTFVRTWISNKMSSYDNRKNAHREELVQRVLAPLRTALVDNLELFSHQKSVVFETWERLSFAKTVRATEDPAVFGALLEVVNPWTDVLAGIDRALLEDAKTTHFKQLIAETLAFVTSWEGHSAHCLRWVGEIAGTILKRSKMNPYGPGITPPYVLHLRLGVFVYRRLFQLPTERLYKKPEGQYFSVEGAPTAPDVIGVASLSGEALVDELLETMDRIIEENRENAAVLLSESKGIRAKATQLRDKLELAIASKRLHHKCDLVPFF